jgi:hypothetical protein
MRSAKIPELVELLQRVRKWTLTSQISWKYKSILTVILQVRDGIVNDILVRSAADFFELTSIRFYVVATSPCTKMLNLARYNISITLWLKCPGAGCIKKWLKLTIIKCKRHPIRSTYLKVNHYLTTK